MLQIVFLGAVVGAAALQLGAKAEPFLTLNRSVLELVQKALWWVIRLAPLGTLGLIGKAVVAVRLGPARAAGDVHRRRLRRLRCIVLAVVYPRCCSASAGSARCSFYAGAWPAIQLAFVSRSSVGTMPLTQQVTTSGSACPGTTPRSRCRSAPPPRWTAAPRSTRRSRRSSSPRSSGSPLGVKDYLLIAFVSVVGSAATAGLTGAIVMLTLTLSTLGLPLAGAGLLLAVDPILDMMRTATNVAGQALVPVLVARREGILDLAVYDAPKGDLPTRQRRVPRAPARAGARAGGRLA